MVRILYSLALFVTREVDRLFPPIEHHIYNSTGFLLFLLTQIDKKPSPSAFGTYICLRLQKISISFSGRLYKSPKLIHIPTGAGRRAALYFWLTSRCRGMVAAQLLIPYL
jgi:hypothetical protein